MSVTELARLEEEVGAATRRPARRLLLVNGPPRAGKDTVGAVLQEFFPGNVYVTKMAKALKERAHALYGLFAEGEPLRHDAFEAVKDQPSDLFLGKTPRQVYIAVSEMLMKPLHGEEVWGDLLVDDIRLNAQEADLVVVTDSGFAREAVPAVRMFGPVESTLVRIERTGTSFEGDSRGWIRLEGLNTWTVDNNGSFLDLAHALSDVLGFDITYRVEVQLPAGNTGLSWFEQGNARTSIEQALAAVEALRQGGYGQRVLRVVAGRNTVVKMVMPGDAPITELR